MGQKHRRSVALSSIVAMLLLTWSGLTTSKPADERVDAQGAGQHDRQPPAAPPTKLSVLAAAQESSAIAHLRIEPGDGIYLVWADNRLSGPIEVLLSSTGSTNMRAEPALPARATVPASGSVLVTRLGADGPGRNGSFALSLRGVPGNPSARPMPVEYSPPLRQPNSRIDQGFDGQFSHDDEENRYSLDFAADIGTPVLAARAGTVMQIEAGFSKAGDKKETYAGRANFVRILHDDGSMALYAHLKTGGVLVRIGQHVDVGQQIALSGNTGFTTGPHLHFAVQVNRGMRLVSIAFRMSGIRPPP